MTYDRTLLVAYKTFETPETANLGDGRIVEALGFGAEIRKFDSKAKKLRLVGYTLLKLCDKPQKAVMRYRVSCILQ